jgi:hypothetical protein
VRLIVAHRINRRIHRDNAERHTHGGSNAIQTALFPRSLLSFFFVVVVIACFRLLPDQTSTVVVARPTASQTIHDVARLRRPFGVVVVEVTRSCSKSTSSKSSVRLNTANRRNTSSSFEINYECRSAKATGLCLATISQRRTTVIILGVLLMSGWFAKSFGRSFIVRLLIERDHALYWAAFHSIVATIIFVNFLYGYLRAVLARPEPAARSTLKRTHHCAFVTAINAI